MGSRFSRIAAPLTGVLAVLAAVGFVLAAPRLLDLSGHQAAIPPPPAGTVDVTSIVAPGPPTPPGTPGQTAAGRPSEAPPSGGAGSTASTASAAPGAFSGIAPSERLSGGGISATPQPGVGEVSDRDNDDGGPSHTAKDHKAHHGHDGHGKGHEHHGNGQGVGHSGDGDQQDSDYGKHNNGKHNGATKPTKDPPQKSNDSLGSGHGHGKKSDREHGQGAKHGKSERRAHSHSRSRR